MNIIWINKLLFQCLDCGTPNASNGVVIEHINGTQFDATVIFYCDEALIPDTVIEAVCGSTGVWNPNPANHLCVNQSSGKQSDYYPMCIQSSNQCITKKI